MTSMKCLHTIVEDGNQVYALDYRGDGLKFATAGQDYQVRIYDEATKTLQSTLSGGYGRSKAGHSNRVFSLKYSSTDDNIILSGGWDNTIQIWDVRQDVPVRSVFGPHITGDAVDLYGHEILSGSWRPDKQLQVFDAAQHLSCVARRCLVASVVTFDGPACIQCDAPAAQTVGYDSLQGLPVGCCSPRTRHAT